MINRVDVDYFEQCIRPQPDEKQIKFFGEANHVQKNLLMGKAVATLFPIAWREPFGLVMIESMVAGTPVIARNRGAASEVIAHGQTGFLCQTIEDCIVVLKQVEQLDRAFCRSWVSHHFSVKQMADGYEAVYQQVLSKRLSQNGKSLSASNL